jgi:hypothetical protein
MNEGEVRREIESLTALQQQAEALSAQIESFLSAAIASGFSSVVGLSGADDRGALNRARSVALRAVYNIGEAILERGRTLDSYEIQPS